MLYKILIRHLHPDTLLECEPILTHSIKYEEECLVYEVNDSEYPYYYLNAVNIVDIKFVRIF